MKHLNRGKKAKREPFYEELLDFLNNVSKYDQRSAVIVIAAKLDSLLYRVIKKMTLPSRQRDDELLDGDGPLSSFSAKIAMAYRLGRIDADLARALHLIRKIRNDFAHTPESCALDLSPHAERIRELVNYYREYLEEYRQYREGIAKVLEAQGLFVDFFTICSLLLGTLLEAAHRSKKWRSRDVPHMALIPAGWSGRRQTAKLIADINSGEFERRVLELQRSRSVSRTR